MDERPSVWIGHVVLLATDVVRSAQWWAELGMREVYRGEEMSIFELRGGTHLLIFPTDQSLVSDAPAPFDLMVDDIVATRTEWATRGLAPSACTSAPGDHQVFTVSDPDGYVVRVFSSHVMGAV
jgi:catechol 2,3-dioxygenase-like lactoylglutathione lyase family enzyme